MVWKSILECVCSGLPVGHLFGWLSCQVATREQRLPLMVLLVGDMERSFVELTFRQKQKLPNRWLTHWCRSLVDAVTHFQRNFFDKHAPIAKFYQLRASINVIFDKSRTAETFENVRTAKCHCRRLINLDQKKANQLPCNVQRRLPMDITKWL